MSCNAHDSNGLFAERRLAADYIERSAPVIRCLRQQLRNPKGTKGKSLLRLSGSRSVNISRLPREVPFSTQLAGSGPAAFKAWRAICLRIQIPLLLTGKEQSAAHSAGGFISDHEEIACGQARQRGEMANSAAAPAPLPSASPARRPTPNIDLKP